MSIPNLSLVIKNKNEDNIPSFIIDLDYFLSKLRRTSVEFIIISDNDSSDLQNTISSFNKFIKNIRIFKSTELEKIKEERNFLYFLNINKIDFSLMEKINDILGDDNKNRGVVTSFENKVLNVYKKITGLLIKMLGLKIDKEINLVGSKIFYFSSNSGLSIDTFNQDPIFCYLLSRQKGDEWELIEDDSIQSRSIDYLSLWFSLIKLKIK